MNPAIIHRQKTPLRFQAFLTFLVALTIFAGRAAVGKEAKAAESTSNPNIIVIYTDDQGFGDVSALNPECKFKTPNLDRLIREGLSFTDAHCSDTVCTPSRYGLLTGRYSWRTTLKKGVMGAEGKCLIADDRLTVASMLKQRGYRTAMVGKWHLGMDFPGQNYKQRDWSEPVQNMPLDKGFDYFFGIPASLNYGVLAWFEGRHAKVPPTLFTAKKTNTRHLDYRIMPPYQSSPEATQQLLGKKGMEIAPDFVDNQCLTRFTDKAMEWIGHHQKTSNSQPFFLYLPLTSPHYPVCPLPEFHGQGQAGGYGEFMIETDHHVGRILDFLDNKKLSENTLIFFTSDNGPERSWVQRVDEFGHRSNYIYREGKRSIYEGGHRVPFIVRWPAGIKNPGRAVQSTVCQTDVFATVAELVEFTMPDSAGEDSQSFLPAFSTAEKQDRVPLIHHSASGGFAIRRGEWKLVMPHANRKLELFNLQKDPSEKNNIASEHSQIVSDLTAEISAIVTRGRSTAGKNQANETGYWADLKWMTESEFEQQSAKGKF